MAEALFLNGNPLSHQRDKSAWFNDFQHRAEGQHPNKQLGLIVLVVTEPDLIEPIGQLLSLFSNGRSVAAHVPARCARHEAALQALRNFPEAA